MQEVPLTASCYNKPARPFTARRLEFDRAARWRRGLGSAGKMLAGALVTAFVPVVHFVAVPSFLVVAVVLGVSRLKQESLLVSIEGSCPACDKPVSLSPNAKTRFPWTAPCPDCGEFIKLVEQEAEPA